MNPYDFLQSFEFWTGGVLGLIIGMILLAFYIVRVLDDEKAARLVRRRNTSALFAIVFGVAAAVLLILVGVNVVSILATIWSEILVLMDIQWQVLSMTCIGGVLLLLLTIWLARRNREEESSHEIVAVEES